MKLVKWIVLGLSLLTVALGVSAKLQALGGQGVFTLVMAVLPAALVGGSLAIGRPFGRLLAGLSLVAFLIVGMKTSSSDDLDNIMMAAFAGLVVSLVALVKPERLAAGALARSPS